MTFMSMWLYTYICDKVHGRYYVLEKKKSENGKIITSELAPCKASTTQWHGKWCYVGALKSHGTPGLILAPTPTESDSLEGAAETGGETSR